MKKLSDLLRDTAGWCQGEEELREALRLAADELGVLHDEVKALKNTHRDWFACHALSAACTLAFGNIDQATTMGYLPEEWAAKIAYSVSDAMISARKMQ